MRFKKMHGLGNDFVILDQREVKGMLTNAQITAICDRNFGVGCDQLVVLGPSKDGDVFAWFYNADGSESGACGNASRCVADLAMAEMGLDLCTIETSAGLLPCRRVGDLIEVDMGPAYLEWKDIPLAHEEDTLELPIGNQEGLSNPAAVGMGNPHCVFFVDDLDDLVIEELGAIYEHHTLFPARTNVEFAQIISKTKIRQKTWERGAGVTLACGSGACAVAVAAARRELTGRKVEIELDGGTLHIEWRESDDHVLMTGSIEHVFDGVLKNI